MNPLTVGMYVLLALGAVVLIVALGLFRRRDEGLKKPIAASAVAVLLLGLGTFGMTFMDPYTRLLGTLLGTKGDSGDTSKYATFFADVANGKLDESHTAVGLAHTLSHPVPEMEKIITSAIRTGTSDAGKQRLRSVLAALSVKQNEAELVLAAAIPSSGVIGPSGATGPSGPTGIPTRIEAHRLDPGVRNIVENHLVKFSASDLAKVPMDAELRKAVDAKRIR